MFDILSGVLGGLGGGLFGGMLGDPYRDAAKEAGKGYKEAQGYQQPYYQHGLDAYGGINTALQKLLNPAALSEEWSKNYATSPEAQRAMQMNMGQGMDAASAMGLMGSSGALQNIQQGAGDIMLQDKQRFLNDLMQKYMAGIGLGSNIYGLGAGAGQNMADRAFSHGENMAGLKYGEKQAPLQFAGGLLGSFLGGGR